MLTEERFAEILRIVNTRKSVTVQELKELLDASEYTIRRDMTALHKRKLLVKVHGGATALGLDYTGEDVTVPSRMGFNPEEKRSLRCIAAVIVTK